MFAVLVTTPAIAVAVRSQVSVLGANRPAMGSSVSPACGSGWWFRSLRRPHWQEDTRSRGLINCGRSPRPRRARTFIKQRSGVIRSAEMAGCRPAPYRLARPQFSRYRRSRARDLDLLRAMQDLSPATTILKCVVNPAGRGSGQHLPRTYPQKHVGRVNA